MPAPNASTPNVTSGLDTTHRDASIRPQDDLFRSFNGGWLKSAQIPDDRASDGAFYALRDQSEARVREIIEGAHQSDEGRKVSDLYRSLMATNQIEALGISPIAAELAIAETVHDRASFITAMAQLEARGTGGLFSATVYTDAMDSMSNIIYLSQGGLSLPDEAYYREDQYQPIREALVAHIARMCELAGVKDGSIHAKEILTLETQIASHHWDQVRDRDATLTYNKATRAELEQLSQGFDWKAYLHAAQVPAEVIESTIVREPSFFTGLGQLLENFHAQQWKSWLLWQVISSNAPYLHDAIVQENFAFYGTTLSGTPQLRDRWKRAVGLVEGAMGEAIGRIYVEQHFPPAAKARMVELVENLIEAYRRSIRSLDWMSSETKAKALEKLEKFTPKIGYPDNWRDYSALKIESDDLMGNLARIARFGRDFELAKLGKPVDRSEWYMTPQTVNAYYNPGMNEIVFPAAILQPPFFDLAADDAVNYGAIGAVIGHEIGHGFDDQGSKYDGDGNLQDWWSDADRSEFEKRANALIAQYSELAPEETPDTFVNGALTVGENIGDLGGLGIAYQAYLIARDGKAAPVIDELTGDERFFYSWASAWRGKVRPEELKRRIATDPHSPGEFRCNQVVRNLDEFYRAFGVSENDSLWLKPEARVRIW